MAYPPVSIRSGKRFWEWSYKRTAEYAGNPKIKNVSLSSPRGPPAWKIQPNTTFHAQSSESFGEKQMESTH